MSDTGSSSSSASSSSSCEVFHPAQILPPSNPIQLPSNPSQPPSNPTQPPSNSTQPPSQSQSEHANPPLPSNSIDSSFILSSNPSSSLPSTQLPLSSFTSNNVFTQNTQATSITDDIQSSPLPPSDNNSQSQALKSTPLTAPTRAWISQRIAKTIHIEEDISNKPDPSHTLHLDPNQNDTSAISSSQRIIELGIVEEQLSQLLSLASDVLGSLTPSLSQEQSSADQSIENFSKSISQYFELLNKIQLGLRTSMAYLRVARISTRILFEPVHVKVPNCPVGLGNIRLNEPSPQPPSFSGTDLNQDQLDSDDGVGLSLGSLIAERDAWKDFVDSLKSIMALHSPKPSDFFIPC